jgi:hypothetical protein
VKIFGLESRSVSGIAASLCRCTLSLSLSLTATLASVFFVESKSEAGMLVTAGMQWANFVFEPKAQEETPNYYGYGARTSAGYSLDQVLDVAIYGEYSPGRLNSASSSGSTALVTDYGAEIGVRILQTMYLGARGGQWNYQLTRRTADEEIGGSWTGVGGAASFGMLVPVNKEVQWQASLDFGQALIKKKNYEADDVEKKARVISRASVTVSFVYNSRYTPSTWGSIFN